MKLLNLTLVLLIFMGCNSVKKTNKEYELAGRKFSMQTYKGLANALDSFPNGMPTIAFEGDSSIGGKTGCNSFFGNYKQQKNKVQIDIEGMTKMYCMGVDEQGFIHCIESANSFEFTDNKLHLLKDGKVVMVLFEDMPTDHKP